MLYNIIYYIETQKVICLNNRVIYESIHIAQEHFGNIDIYACCKGLNKYAGTIDNARLVWRYYDVYLKMSNEDIEKLFEV